MSADVTVREVMDREYVGVSESDDLVETVELMLREGVDTALVLRGSEPVGAVTERDVLALVVEGPDPQGAVVADAMTASLPTIQPDRSLSAAVDAMSTRSARRLVVTPENGAEPLGVLTERDLLAGGLHAVEDRDRHPVETAPPAAGTATAVGTEAETDAEDSFEDQGICEACGTLTQDLVSFNGQLLCSDCRDL